jgi:hypothetical protein
MTTYSEFQINEYEKLIRNLERCKRHINYMQNVDQYVNKDLVGGRIAEEKIVHDTYIKIGTEKYLLLGAKDENDDVKVFNLNNPGAGITNLKFQDITANATLVSPGDVNRNAALSKNVADFKKEDKYIAHRFDSLKRANNMPRIVDPVFDNLTPLEDAIKTLILNATNAAATAASAASAVTAATTVASNYLADFEGVSTKYINLHNRLQALAITANAQNTKLRTLLGTAKGATGATGAQGAQGATGATGAQRAIGAIGATGAD